VLDSNEPMNMLNMTLKVPSNLNYTLFKGSGLDGVTVDSLPPSVIGDMPYAVDEGYVSDCCRFITLMMSMPPTSGGVPNLNVDFELEFGPFNGDGPRMIMLLDPSLWRTLMLKKDLNPEILRWVLLMHQFNFKALNKGL